MLNIAHRGASGYEPENTLLAFTRALELGANAIELDVCCCKSGEVVVIHDATLERTTDGFGRVADATLAELKRLDAGDGETIPTLEEVLDLVERRAVMFIEIKDAEAGRKVADIVTRYVREKQWRYDQLMVIGFDHHELVKVKQINSDIHIGATLCAKPIDYAACATLCGATAINPGHELLDEAFMQDARRRGLKVYVWTANEAEDIARAKALGVDGIITDYPDRL